MFLLCVSVAAPPGCFVHVCWQPTTCTIIVCCDAGLTIVITQKAFLVLRITIGRSVVTSLTLQYTSMGCSIKQEWGGCQDSEYFGSLVGMSCRPCRVVCSHVVRVPACFTPFWVLGCVKGLAIVRRAPLVKRPVG
jgi:hypothetical protein